MIEETHSRLLPVKGAYNMRDLGGYPAAGQKHIKWRTLLRSGDLNQLTEADLNYLASLPLRTDIDFRGKTEVTKAPDKIPPATTYYPLPLEAGDMSDMQQLDPARIPTILQEIYAYIVRSAQDTYAAFFRMVSDEQNAPLLFHCSAGKDRTGMAAVYLLSALGVDRETVIQDYLLSATYIKGKYDFIVQRYPQFEPLTTVKREYIEAAFQVIDNEFEGMERYLTQQLGADIEKLREIYTE